MKAKTIIGWRECVGLPDFGIEIIKAKIDTGAQTSSLHAFNARRFNKDDEDWVRFKVHPQKRRRRPEILCEAKIIDIRSIVSSNGARERRLVIATTLQLGPFQRKIEITLANRDEMGYRMLVGREALRKMFIVDPGSSYTFGGEKRKSL